MFAIAQATGHNDLQKQCNTKAYKSHVKNKQICQELRDAAFQASEDLEYPCRLNTIKNMQKTLNKLGEHGCYENSFLPRIDRDLLKKLDTDLKK